jgi:hypothetical protein
MAGKIDDRLPIAAEEGQEAVAQNRMLVACSVVKRGPIAILKLGFRNGEVCTLALDSIGQFHLLRTLKALVPNTEHVGEAS